MAKETERVQRLHKGLALAALIAAGESVFFLPFVLARVFRPTMLEVFQLSNLELGAAFSIYGVVAMIAYAPGGPLADTFAPRKLLATALLATAAGGLAFATIPSLSSLKFLYAYWGLTTIALFWAALMRATRQWGGETNQGIAFGWLDGGRGLLTAVTGSALVAIFVALLPEDIAQATLDQRTEAFRQIILILSALTGMAAALVWFALPQRKEGGGRATATEWNFHEVRHVLTMPAVWLQAFIIICAYVGFKATDDFALYAHQVLGLDEVEAATAGTVSLYMRPVAAIGAGYLADRSSGAVMTILSFALLALGGLALASDIIQTGMLSLFLVTVMGASLGIFALRGLYFAIMKEGEIPLAFTGTAVGLVSVVGYSPDIFMGPLMGYLLDTSPGPVGHQQVFSVVTGFSFAGLLASTVFFAITRKYKPDKKDLS